MSVAEFANQHGCIPTKTNQGQRQCCHLLGPSGASSVAPRSVANVVAEALIAYLRCVRRKRRIATCSFGRLPRARQLAMRCIRHCGALRSQSRRAGHRVGARRICPPAALGSASRLDRSTASPAISGGHGTQQLTRAGRAGRDKE